MKLKNLGFNHWYEENSIDTNKLEYSIARVISVNKNNYIIRNEKTEIPAEVTGKIIYGAESNLDLPTVGDWVQVQYFDKNTLAIIHKILPRKSLLKRKMAGKKIEYQLVASNIDTAFIVQSLDSDFNLRRLERYLIMTNESTIKPIILLSKCDLVSQDYIRQKISTIKNITKNYKIIIFSNKTLQGLNEIKTIIKSGETYCLLGSSGVGKTTLLNNLIGEDIYATSTVREKDGKGRHITNRRQLIILEQGGLIIDTPGMRELGHIDIKAGLNETFIDIAQLAEHCRFKNCTHTNEPECSVIEAIKKGELSEKRFQNYLKIQKESEYYNMSYIEKRKKSKQFGKMYKAIKKTIKKRLEYK